MICRVALKFDIAGILNLQSKNLYTNLFQQPAKYFTDG